MEDYRNGLRKRLTRTVALSEGDRYKRGTEVVIRHYAFGINEDGSVKESEIYLRVETLEVVPRVIHVKRDELTSRMYLMRDILTWMKNGESREDVLHVYDEIIDSSTLDDVFIVVGDNATYLKASIARIAADRKKFDGHYDERGLLT